MSVDVLNGDTVAQLAHFFAGAAMVLGISRFTKERIAVAATTAIAAAKESAESLGWAVWEPIQPWLSSTKDFSFFLVGITAALLVLHFSPKDKESW